MPNHEITDDYLRILLKPKMLPKVKEVQMPWTLHLMDKNAIKNPFTNAYSSRRYCCNIARTRAKLAFAICHTDRNNGNGIPRMLLQDHTMSDRPPTSLPGKKRRRRTTSKFEQKREDSAEVMAAVRRKFRDSPFHCCCDNL
ncbi:hypothetical protein PHMEG_00014987 [Phytophthora megakarya]|uniref:Uncharacterized protein n=1 Tax=Phytophthora megakarya TaxID=4795 RepID=A0A225W2Z6_9STRA|nr:hypothetical protein PHMEG_00014987 [Phytophthora megakarya]